MIVLGFDTATPATAVALRRADGVAYDARHDPAPGERPGHATQLLALVDEVLAAARVDRAALTRIAVGVGPGSFTGLRIGVGTARALAQALDVELVGVSTLRALAAGAPGDDRPVAAILDARRGEAFAAAWSGDKETMAPAALSPDALAAALADLPAPPLAIGDGAVRFRPQIEAAGAAVPPDDDPLHRIAARHLCELAAQVEPAGRDAVVPRYVRAPDAQPTIAK